MRDHLARKAARMSPLDVQLAALRAVHDQVPPGQQASFLARLDEVARAWSGDVTAEPDPPRRTTDTRSLFAPQPQLPAGHPIPWEDLVTYERQQGGYWLYGTDPYGADKRWVRVRRPAEAGES